MPTGPDIQTTRPWRILGGEVLAGAGLAPADLFLAGGRIAAEDRGGRTLDATGLHVLPGLVDVHGDAFERQVMPRPGVGFALRTALLDTDRQLVANGITTAYHGVTWSWEPGLRGGETAAALLDTLEALAGVLRADTRFHLRHETFNLDGEAAILGWIAAGRIGCLAFNDHMEGTLKTRSRPDKVAKMIERTGLDRDDFFRLAEAVHARREEVHGSIARLAWAATAAGIPTLSHDDMTPDMRRWYRGLGVGIAEFPITEATAAEAAALGEPVIFGAPNVVRGGSHTGCPTATEMAARGLCTVLASDYYYPALLAAPYRLARDGVLPFAAAYALVSANPARAFGLDDRGEIAPGRRGDVLLVDPGLRGGEPEVVATFVAGRLVHLAGAERLVG